MNQIPPATSASARIIEIDRDRFPRRWISGVLLICLVAGILFLRAPETLLLPPLLFDDGKQVFTYFYQHRGAVEILRFKSGYLPLIGNLIGYLSVRLPTRWIPYGMAGSAFLISVATYALFFARPFRRWVPSDFQRALICLLFALAPVSDCFLLTVSDYSLWNLLVALILLTAIPPPARPVWRYLHLILCNLLVWSHPLSLLIMPLAVWRALRQPEHRLFYGLLILNLVIHQIFGVAGILTTRGLWEARGATVSLVQKLFLSGWWTVQLVPSIAFRTAFGEPVFEEVIRQASWLITSWFVAVVIGAAYVSRRSSNVRGLLLYLVYLIGALTFLSCCLRYENVHGDPFAFIRYSPRYIYIQSLSFLVIYAVLLARVVELGRATMKRFRNASGASLSGSLWPSVPLFLLLVHYFYLNTQLGYFVPSQADRGGSYHSPDPANGPIVRQFFARLAELESSQGSRNGIRLEAPKRNDWPIVIDTTRRSLSKPLRFTHRSRVAICFILVALLAFATRDIWLSPFSRLARRRVDAPQ